MDQHPLSWEKKNNNKDNIISSTKTHDIKQQLNTMHTCTRRYAHECTHTHTYYAHIIAHKCTVSHMCEAMYVHVCMNVWKWVAIYSLWSFESVLEHKLCVEVLKFLCSPVDTELLERIGLVTFVPKQINDTHNTLKIITMLTYWPAIANKSNYIMCFSTHSTVKSCRMTLLNTNASLHVSYTHTTTIHVIFHVYPIHPVIASFPVHCTISMGTWLY